MRDHEISGTMYEPVLNSNRVDGRAGFVEMDAECARRSHEGRAGILYRLGNYLGKPLIKGMEAARKAKAFGPGT
jgi:hypothetical protein